MVEVLAENTSEADEVFRVGSLVIKYLRSPESFEQHPNGKLRMSAADTLARWRAMEAISGTPPLNRLHLCRIGERYFFVAPFIAGRNPTPEELQDVVRLTDRLGVLDVTADNVIMSDRGPVVVDWFMRDRQSSCPGPDRDRGTAPT